ncbi:MAG: AAA family ATPase [Gammaproteobacteria bacterium]|nr:AAA family ATPase [Gammaproteobacteria bacterium]
MAQALRCGIVIRQRIHNPAQLTPEELKASFIARHETHARMLQILAEQRPGHPCQHVIVVGARGMGKTTLGLSFLQAVREDPAYSSKWLPVPFPEESYEVGDLADFWLAALHHLTEATGQQRWGATADALRQGEPDADRSAAYALAALLDFCEEEGKRLILFVENLDLLFGQLRDDREVYALRAALMEHPEIFLVGSANAVFNAIQSDGEPFYEFFRLVTLRGLNEEECRELLSTLAGRETDAAHSVPLDIDEARLETIRQLTGGNPRLLVLACRMLLESPLGSAMDDLERLIDEQTPYFKARIEALPPQARKVFHCLAQAWSPLLAREVAARAKLGSSHASSQLRQLIDKGYVREVQRPEETRGRYEVSDRFYNIYYLVRFSRAGRDRLERLVEFLHQLCGPVGMRHAHTETRELLARVPQSGKLDAGRRDLHRWTQRMISLIARGHAAEVRQMLAVRDLTESLEPLWHAARVELGEDLGPLPAEVMDAVKEVRRRVAEERG